MIVRKEPIDIKDYILKPIGEIDVPKAPNSVFGLAHGSFFLNYQIVKLSNGALAIVTKYCGADDYDVAIYMPRYNDSFDSGVMTSKDMCLWNITSNELLTEEDYGIIESYEFGEFLTALGIIDYITLKGTNSFIRYAALRPGDEIIVASVTSEDGVLYRNVEATVLSIRYGENELTVKYDTDEEILVGCNEQVIDCDYTVIRFKL